MWICAAHFSSRCARSLDCTRPKKRMATKDKTELDLDWVAHDLRKFVRLLTEHNGYVLEQLYFSARGSRYSGVR
jgi:hypothetical protein